MPDIRSPCPGAPQVAVVNALLSDGDAEKLADGLLPRLLFAVAKSIEVQLRTRVGTRTVSSVTMAPLLGPTTDSPWVRGKLTTELASEVLSLLVALTSGQLGPAWATHSKALLRDLISKLPSLQDRDSQEVIRSPTLWLALAALTAVDEETVAAMQESLAAQTQTGDVLRCTNHDDGTTEAMHMCSECDEQLCADCDRIIHLHKSRRSHVRKRLQKAEAQIALELHEGCARAKLAAVMVVIDRKNLKGILEFRALTTRATCRFCVSPLGEDAGVAQLVASGIQVSILRGTWHGQEKGREMGNEERGEERSRKRESRARRDEKERKKGRERETDRQRKREEEEARGYDSYSCYGPSRGVGRVRA